MAFDPTISPHYKIIQVPDIGSQTITYLSETDTWSVSGDTNRVIEFEGFEEGVYWNDAIHWLNPYDKFKTRLCILS
uniref:Uncharacterized protein n=1 Tax=Tanacetum cinerariifolium TaxID=118510 RepID=A0A699J3A3_TANCI|nr:hypothetical protein [Tanacetum cinerariifolium]